MTGNNSRRALLAFASTLVADEDTGAPVHFRSVGGTVTLERYGTTPGDRIEGTFNAALQGFQRVFKDDRYVLTERSGRMTGGFEIVFEPAK